MIIDLILNRKDGQKYEPKRFYNEVMSYGEIGYPIAEAMDNEEESDVRKSLENYIKKNNYNLSIINYINSQNWL